MKEVSIRKDHIAFIDGLRAIAALMVLNFHALESGVISIKMCSENMFLLIPGIIIGAGHTGVELFFFISGFCLCRPYVSHQFAHGKPASLKQYFYKRVFKIFPSYVVALTIISLFFPRPDGHIALWKDYLLHLFFLHNLNPQTFSSIAAAFWSLAVEVEFYIIFPMIIGIFQKKPIHVLFASILLSVGYRLIIIHAGLAWRFFYDYQLLDFLDIFVFGMTAAYVISRQQYKPIVILNRKNLMTMFSFCSIFAFIGLQCVVLNNTTRPGVWYTLNEIRDLYGILLFAFVITVYFGAPWMKKCLEWKFLGYFSAISYNLYLWNKTIIMYIGGITKTWALPQPAEQLIVAALGLGIPILIATVLTLLVEQPFLRIKLRWAVSRAANG